MERGLGVVVRAWCDVLREEGLGVGAAVNCSFCGRRVPMRERRESEGSMGEGSGFVGWNVSYDNYVGILDFIWRGFWEFVPVGCRRGVNFWRGRW